MQLHSQNFHFIDLQSSLGSLSDQTLSILLFNGCRHNLSASSNLKCCCNLRKKKKCLVQNSPIAVLAISVRCCPGGLTEGECVGCWMLYLRVGAAGKALSQQRRGLPVRLEVCYELRQISGKYREHNRKCVNFSE